MREPCITPSGITYDRKDIEEHLQVKVLLVYILNTSESPQFMTAGLCYSEGLQCEAGRTYSGEF